MVERVYFILAPGRLVLDEGEFEYANCGVLRGTAVVIEAERDLARAGTPCGVAAIG
jgi:hypothetical protein